MRNTYPLLPLGVAALILLFVVGSGGAEKEAPPAKATAQATPSGPTFARPSKLTVGYIGTITVMQVGAVQQKGWFQEQLGMPVQYIRFTSGTPLLQALAAGQVDVAYLGFGPALTAVHQRVPAKVVAVNSKDAYGFAASTKFANIWAKSSTAAAFKEFQRQEGRKLRIASFPKWTAPDAWLRYWLVGLGVDPTQDVEIVGMGEDRLVTAVVSGQLDGAFILEPLITLILRRDPVNFKPIVWSRDIRSNQIAQVVLVKQNLIDQYPEMMERLVKIQMQATKLLKEDREFWAQVTVKYLESLSLEDARAAVNSPAANLASNLRDVAPSVLLFDRFMVQQGVYPSPIAIGDLVDFRFYDRVVKKHPELND